MPIIVKSKELLRVEHQKCANWVTIFNGVLTPLFVLIAIATFGLNWWQVTRELASQAEQGREDREKFRTQIGVQQQQLVHLTGAFQNQQIGEFYGLAHYSQDFLARNPTLNEYFGRGIYSKLSAKEHCDRMRTKFDTETEERKLLILIGSEILADFMETAYSQKETLPLDDGEWNTWWNYFMDCYDESFVIRDHFASRPDWYTIDDMLRSERRFNGYIGDKCRRAVLMNQRKAAGV